MGIVVLQYETGPCGHLSGAVSRLTQRQRLGSGVESVSSREDFASVARSLRRPRVIRSV